MTYLIRYGAMGHVARFRATPHSGGPFHRGQAVVIQSNRGVELGEVLIRLDGPALPESIDAVDPDESDKIGWIETNGQARVLRAAGSEDLARAETILQLRPVRFSYCQRIVEDEGWPWELLDVEPLLDGQATVLHYLGAHELDAASVRARFRIVGDFDVVLEPVGGEYESTETVTANLEHGCGNGCGLSGCGSDGACGIAAASGAKITAGSSEEENDRKGHPSRGGCESCAISRWIATRSR